MNMQNSYLTSKPHYEILDGLRGVAAAMVVAFHLLEAHSGGNPVRSHTGTKMDSPRPDFEFQTAQGSATGHPPTPAHRNSLFAQCSEKRDHGVT